MTLCLLILLCFSGAYGLPCLCLEKVTEGLGTPVSMKESSTGHLWVTTKEGLFYSMPKDNPSAIKVVFNISSWMPSVEPTSEEAGVLAMELHWDFDDNGLFYIYYTKSPYQSILSEMKREGESITFVGDVLSVDQPHFKHNGGGLISAPDGSLFLALGDGGGTGDNPAQNSTSFLGKVLKLNLKGPRNNVGYIDPEIFATGFRNPWRCSIDNGHSPWRLLCGDVGENKYEEVDHVTEGSNYGWNILEGNSCVGNTCTKPANYQAPLFVYEHVGEGFQKTKGSITGGYVYRGCQIPDLRGRYVYGDFYSRELIVMSEGKDNAWSESSLSACDSCSLETETAGEFVLSLAEDRAGEVYVLTRNFISDDASNGKLYKLVDPANSDAECGTPQPSGARKGGAWVGWLVIGAILSELLRI